MFLAGCGYELSDITTKLATMSPAPWIVVSWLLNEVYNPRLMLNGGHGQLTLERVSLPSPDDPHNRTRMIKSVDEMVAVLRLRTMRAKVIIGARHSLYGLHPSFDDLCVMTIARFRSHGIHAESGDPTFHDLEHVGIHVLKSHANNETLSRRFMDHIADARLVPGT